MIKGTRNLKYDLITSQAQRRLAVGLPCLSKGGIFCTVVHTGYHFYVEVLFDLNSVLNKKR
jgi:hypothetical protein